MQVPMGSQQHYKPLHEYAASRRWRIEEALSIYLPEATSNVLADAMRYAIFSGGKRIRPLLCIASAEACGGTIEQVLPVACGLELVHAFSLIHDDLPALDNDSMRRGVPTCHVKYGEAMAILAGDALLARAFELITEVNCPPKEALRTIKLVSAALGIEGMVGGQVADLESEGKEIARPFLESIHNLKTGALIRASTASGAILAGADEDAISALGTYGEALGLAFQIQDDVLGATGDPIKMGKPVGKDLERGKATYPRILGLKEAMKAGEEKVQEALHCLRRFDERAEPLRQLALYTLQRDR
jgi:geranylgeranyl diphosphate synthase type II